MDHAKSKSNNGVLQDLNINCQSEISWNKTKKQLRNRNNHLTKQILTQITIHQINIILTSHVQFFWLSSIKTNPYL